MYDPTVARLTYRALLGRRRALILGALPVLLIVIASVVRLLTGADDQVASDVLGGFALATMVPIIGVIAGTGAIGPEIDDGSVVYLLAKPLKRPTIIFTKLIVAVAVTMAFSAVPTFIAGMILNGNGQQIAVAYTVAALVASIAYAAMFLLLGTVTRHAVVLGLVYALVWEALFGSLVAGARTLSVQQWALAVAHKVTGGDLVTSDVGLPTATVLLVVELFFLDSGFTCAPSHWAKGCTARRQRGWRSRNRRAKNGRSPGTSGTTSYWTSTSYGPRRRPSRPPAPACSPPAGATEDPTPSHGAPTSRPRAGSSASGGAGGADGSGPRGAFCSVYSVASNSAYGHSGSVHAAASNRRHVLGEERDDAHQQQYVELPTGQLATGRGVVTPPPSPFRTESCPGRSLRARVLRADRPPGGLAERQGTGLRRVPHRASRGRGRPRARSTRASSTPAPCAVPAGHSD